ncbi:MAG: right-handed parallel beta-helix repeat-containing protein [Gemmatimonadaceae bacterium]|nr:right-handed parallel beta-helix repeat-containing protein [Gemmatimonadaceae bacterium]
MRGFTWVVAVVVSVGVVGAAGGCGTKRNPNICCTDEADCSGAGLPIGTTCAPGELCRGHECIELTCAASTQCDLTAPFCNGGTCADSCEDDTSCPGFGQVGSPFCVEEQCVECREGMSDCANARICDGNVCRDCANNDECATGLCTAAGSCATPDDVAFAHPLGSATSACTEADPCTLQRAVALTPTRRFIQISPGSYQNAATLELNGSRVLTGAGADQVSITNTGTGPVLAVADNADITVEGLKIFGAKNGATAGAGITCTTGTLQVRAVIITMNASHGIQSSCKLELREASLISNGGFGLDHVATPPTAYLIERCSVVSNGTGGVRVSGSGIARNNSITRNLGVGLELRSSFQGTAVSEFNTIVANKTNGLLCSALFMTPKPIVANSIVALNETGDFFMASDCTIASTLITEDGFNSAGFRFKSPNSAPFDYHLEFGSIAVDAATGMTAVDFDGDTRPKGTAADVGADEAF